MTIDFRYVPTSGSLSGAAFEKQTERAFNELGQQIDKTTNDVSQALDVVQNAQATAQNALQTAETANSAAQDAHGLAQHARTTADNAAATAGQAQTVADTALRQAAVATTTANSANDSAEQAKILGTGAADTAADARNAADGALAAAQRAMDVSEQATGMFFVDDTVRDADEAYTTTEKSVLTNSDADTPNTNFPADLPMPLWFTVYITDDGTAVTQTCWNDTASVTYTRAATIDAGETDDPVVTWGEWANMNAAQAVAEAALEAATEAMAAIIIGKIDMLPFRASELPVGWYFCNGDQFALASTQGEALNGLSTKYKTDWGVTVSGSTISLPNMFYTDGRGYFIRSVNGSTRQAGSTEDDAIRNITGYCTGGNSTGVAGSASGALYVSGGAGSRTYRSASDNYSLYLDVSRVVPTGPENTVLNVGMTPAIYLGV